MGCFKKSNILWVVIITISITLLGIGCLSSKVTSTNSDIWEPPFEGLQWGMSEAEVMNVLKLTENDVIKNSIGFITKNKLDFLGFKKNVKFILGSYNSLISIIVVFDEKELNKIEKEITKKLGQGKYSYRYGKSFLDKTLSKISWASALLKEQQEHIDIINSILVSNESDSQYWLERYIEKPLVCYTLTFDKKNSTYRQLEISGTLAAMINKPDKFIKND